MSSKKRRMIGCLWIVAAFMLLGGCGGGGNGGDDGTEDQGGDPDVTDGDVQTEDAPGEDAADPRPDDPALEDGAQDDPATGDEQPDGEDPAEVEDTPADEIPVPTVDCGGGVCSDTQECCFTTDPAEVTCVDAGTCDGGVLACDEKADCPGDQVCCHNPPSNIGAECVDSCNRIIVCGGDGDCTEERPNCCPAMGGVFEICVENPCD